ncbi:MAG: SIMPL domain-containing protein, partial [Bacteroidales bacterium]|nr:SIMPL domain-containing protein [Bacteroidales bacterium]
MKRGWFVESCIIALSVIILAFCLKAGIDNFVNKERIVSVKGLAEVEVPADKVIWPIIFSEMGNDLPGLYNKISSTAGKVTNYLIKNGIAESEFSSDAPKAVDLQAERYLTQQKPYRYIVTMVITVT